MQIIAQSPKLSPLDYKTDQTLDDVFKEHQNALARLQQNIAQSPKLSLFDYKTDQTLDDVFKEQQNSLARLQQNAAVKLSFIMQNTGDNVFLGVRGFPSLRIEAYFYRTGNEFNAPCIYSVNLTDF